MKNLLQSKRKAAILLIFIALSSSAWAGTFTATSSGNWSSSSTWSGGTAPSFTNTGDQITIETGVTVTMDNNVTINGTLATLVVNGSLTGGPTSEFSVISGIVSGSGSIFAETVSLGTAAALSFSGNITANTLYSAILSLTALATIQVNQNLTLNEGTLTLGSGGMLSLGSNATIVMAGGKLSKGTGTLSLTSNYNVTYTTGYSSTGIELKNSGLQNVTINPGSGQSVALNGDLTVGDTLNMKSGVLSLNGNTLTINGDIAANGSGTITSTASSNIVISTATTNSGSLWFTSGANTVNNFTVDIADGGWPTLGSSMVVNGILTLTKGTLYISNDTLQIAASGSISGAGGSNYIVTNANGYLAMSVDASASTPMYYPVGTASQFLPANISLNSNSNSGSVYVNVTPNVYGYGTVGTLVSANQTMVDATWEIESNISSNLNLNMQLMWDSTAEVNGFNRTEAYISHFLHGSGWDATATSSATLQSNGLYALTRDSIQSLSPFAVFDNSTKASIQPIANTSSIAGFEIYPNPAMNNIYIQNVASTDKEMYAQIMNVNGQIIGTYVITDRIFPIDVSSLSKGLYFVKLYDNNTSATSKFVKF